MSKLFSAFAPSTPPPPYRSLRSRPSLLSVSTPPLEANRPPPEFLLPFFFSIFCECLSCSVSLLPRCTARLFCYVERFDECLRKFLLTFCSFAVPMSLSMITDAYNGLNRLTAVFLAPEITETFAVDYNSKYAVEVKDASFQWESSPPDAPVFTKKQLKVAAASKKEKKAPVDEEKTADSPPIELMQLDGINLKIPRGSLTAVVGKVGSGKSSLLQALLGEMRRTKGDVTFAGSIAYCPQQSWIRNATLRVSPSLFVASSTVVDKNLDQENILFGQVYEEKKYQQVIKDSCLDADIAMLPNGELTEIGEKGINLSGGCVFSLLAPSSRLTHSRTANGNGSTSLELSTTTPISSSWTTLSPPSTPTSENISSTKRFEERSRTRHESSSPTAFTSSPPATTSSASTLVELLSKERTPSS